jgi:chromosome segregation ATPase
MTNTPQQSSRLDRIEAILERVATQQATNTDAIADLASRIEDLTSNVNSVLARDAILNDVLLEMRDSHEELKRDFLENQRTTNAALNQMNAILLQLTRIDPQN